jgi:hypothetical protein
MHTLLAMSPFIMIMWYGGLQAASAYR